MPDRERHASWQRYNRCCAGRQLQQNLAGCIRTALVGLVDVTADDGIRTRDLRFTKPLLYQLSYVGGRRQKMALAGPCSKETRLARSPLPRGGGGGEAK